ncbi:alginate lyase family protein [Roseomonas sp. AR75]|uniref:alginate lyase family protein n=1 Tax=Roseomonas sp. AR75 TaxID=2562311 RepID=UPI00148556D0|nr:alginate lyase family protein [Roseomonas sp. AR75]
MRPGAALLLSALLAVPARSETLPTPFGAPGPARPLSARPCPAPPSPVVSLQSQGFYTDARASIPDPARVAADRDASRPLTEWLEALQRPTERWVALRDPAEAACALALLHAWAEAGALLGAFNTQAAYHRKWTLAGAALAFLALRDAPAAPGHQARIAAWLAHVARAVRPPYDRPPPNRMPNSVQNNHVAWAGLALAAAGIAAGDRALLRDGMGYGRRFLAAVTPEGAHPQELSRGRMALHYHLFALAPLAALSRLGAAAGERFSAEEAAALDRLARFALAQTRDSTRIAALAGAPQGHLADPARPWLADGQGFEILGLAPEALAPFRPYRQRWLGGNATLLWGR